MMMTNCLDLLRLAKLIGIDFVFFANKDEQNMIFLASSIKSFTKISNIFVNVAVMCYRKEMLQGKIFTSLSNTA